MPTLTDENLALERPFTRIFKAPLRCKRLARELSETFILCKIIKNKKEAIRGKNTRLRLHSRGKREHVPVKGGVSPVVSFYLWPCWSPFATGQETPFNWPLRLKLYSSLAQAS
ncbi:hypothetical protein GN956_G21825 [Arapaima gigas]